MDLKNHDNAIGYLDSAMTQLNKAVVSISEIKNEDVETVRNAMRTINSAIIDIVHARVSICISKDMAIKGVNRKD